MQNCWPIKSAMFSMFMLVVGPVAHSTEKSWTKYSFREIGFSIEFPSAWQVTKPDWDVVRAIQPTPLAGGRYTVANVAFAKDDQTLDARFSDTKSMFKKRAGFKLREEGKAQIDKQPAKFIVYSTNGNNPSGGGVELRFLCGF